ncbi:hypothetical protein Molly5_183 [Maribacter phage Molly_5]|uniref:Uncharacterized protein n=1 Tax=Maribacter phage Molly_1 TaxID=2745685 RepID=A0A8E4UY93_9CAUD|nr:hypothetical protein M1M29_gp183 [Maribacter phage Molly_1]QQO97681.1 hypothetical protein Molly2_183 [Maribacter phage Molly_2]QQO97881.1 hypothetical protein Molly3_183 [Maribacter phage Molly_3]QQO98081.1 hypothetical protein Molly4_183 [Maribacter phage Molly_4]QQO98281.1 hypothetical protein Molly5_183 [Maribacter phage Molly_5]QQO97481.1 hypothetical protein Molly1_183 [Maribacter phage Molly_1]
MRIDTKFSNKDMVVPIALVDKTVMKTCDTCKGTAKLHVVELKDYTTKCPKCSYGKVFDKLERSWEVQTFNISEVGRVTVEYYAKPNTSHVDRITYMLEATGIGSGRVWKEEDLFEDTEQAHDECDKRNAELAIKE